MTTGKSMYEMQREFHQLYGHAHPTTPTQLYEHRMKSRVLWIMEEIVELLMTHDFVSQVHELTDVLVFVIGTFVEMGIDPRDTYEIVHEANMNKKWLDGEIHWDDNGKVLKPTGWLGARRNIADYITSKWKEDHDTLPFSGSISDDIEYEFVNKDAKPEYIYIDLPDDPEIVKGIALEEKDDGTFGE